MAGSDAKALVLFYPERLGHEVYLRLKKALLDNGWAERDCVELPSHDGMRHLLANDLFESPGKATYIEVLRYGDMDVMIIIYGEKLSVKGAAKAIWRK